MVVLLFLHCVCECVCVWATYREGLQTGREQQLQQQEELTNHQTVSAARYAVDLLEESLSDESLIRSSINVWKSGLSQNGSSTVGRLSKMVQK